jgi:hypothetical protein
MVRCEMRQVALMGIVACVLFAVMFAAAWVPLASGRAGAADLTAEQILDRIESTTMLTGERFGHDRAYH